MRCNDCDAHMDEMHSGILHPESNQHLRQCERCTSHFRARATVQNGLRKLASASATGPSPVTDRAVMDSYRRLQQRRAADFASPSASTFASHPASNLAPQSASDPQLASVSGSASAAPTARLFTFPGRSLAPIFGSRTWWTGAAAAAVVFAVFGSAVHLWTGLPSVSAPIVATAPSAPASQQSASVDSAMAASAASRAGAKRLSEQHLSATRTAQLSPRSHASRSHASSSEVATAALRSASPVSSAAAAARPSLAYAQGSNYGSTPVTQQSASVSPVIHLASSGVASNVAQSASSTWPGYSNLMYCDPVVCSGPMQVVHIKVPVRQVKPNLGQTVGNAFVNAEVVIGPDGVARAIRVAN